MYSQQFISLDEARAIAEAGLAEASKEPDRPVAIAIADIMGDIVYLARQDKATPHYTLLAISKAYTAARFGRDVVDLNKTYTNLGWSVRDFVDPKYTPVPGMCIRTSDGTVIGGIGVSGRHGGDAVSDSDLAKAALKTVSL